MLDYKDNYLYPYNSSCVITFTFGLMLLGKDMNPIIPQDKGYIAPLEFFYKDGLDIINPQKLICH